MHEAIHFPSSKEWYNNTLNASRLPRCTLRAPFTLMAPVWIKTNVEYSIQEGGLYNQKADRLVITETYSGHFFDTYITKHVDFLCM